MKEATQGREWESQDICHVTHNVSGATQGASL